MNYIQKFFAVITFLFILFFSISSISVFAENIQNEPTPQYVDPEVFDQMEPGEGTLQVIEPETRKLKGKVVSSEDLQCQGDLEDEKRCSKVVVEIVETGEQVEILLDLRSDLLAREWDLEKGDRVILTEFDYGDTRDYQITELDRTGAIWLFVIIYVVVVLVVGRMQGLGSLIGLALSVFVILEITIPMTLRGWDPIWVALFGGFLVLIPSIYLSHGFNRKTHVALVGTSVGLFFTGILAILAMNTARLTGFGAEESLYVSNLSEQTLSLSSILLASIIIGGIGLIDDVTVGQVAVIQELVEENPKLAPRELYLKAMNVGKDHVASMVNTLFLAYAAASLPLLLLLVNQGASASELMNIEAFAEEIIRTLVASTGLVLTLPITTILGALYFTKKSLVKQLD